MTQQRAAGGDHGVVCAWVMSVRCTYMGDVLNGQNGSQAMLVVLVLKLFAVTVSLSSSMSGITGPSLFIGAMAGGAVGAVALFVAGVYGGNWGLRAVGMGAVFAGISTAPMTFRFGHL